jgi:WD40 repeat protein
VIQNNSIRVWKDYIREHNDVVTCMARDENNLVTATNLGQLNLWDISNLQLNIKNPKLELRHKLYGHLGRINSVDIDNEEGIIVSGNSKIFKLKK